MRGPEKTDLGVVIIHKDTIISLAESAALEVEGVSRLRCSPLSILDNLGIKTQKGVSVEIDENNEVRITVAVVVKYGYNLSEVAHRVQENIRQAIERMTDLTLREVNVDIRGMDTSKKQ